MTNSTLKTNVLSLVDCGSDIDLSYVDPDVRVRLSGTYELTPTASVLDFLYVKRGSLRLTSVDGVSALLSTGDAMAARRHLVAEAVPSADLRIVALSVPNDTEGPAAVRIDLDAPRGAFGAPAATALVDGLVPTAEASIPIDQDGILAGVWQSTPYHRRSMPFPRHEFMHLLEGSVTFQTPEGTSVSFHAGQSFFVPRGFDADWKQVIRTRKIFFIVQPA